MIGINSALKQQEIITMLNGYSENDITFKYVKKEGIKLLFKTSGDPKESVKVVKKVIKAAPWSGALYFQVTVE